MNSQLSYTTAHAHQQDLLRAAQGQRAGAELRHRRVLAVVAALRPRRAGVRHRAPRPALTEPSPQS